MKNLFALAIILCAALVSCSENAEKKSETTIQSETMPVTSDTALSVSPDTSNLNSGKTKQDSVDAAHGHTH